MSNQILTARAPTGNPPTVETVLTAALAVHDRACELLQAVELHQMGYRLGVEEGEHRADQQAERAVAAFINDLSDLGEKPGPLPGPNDPRRIFDYARMEAAA